MRSIFWGVALLTSSLASCGDQAAVVQPSPTVTVSFTLRSTLPPTPDDPMAAAAAQYCVRNLLGRSSLWFSFSDSGYYIDESTIGVGKVVVPDVPRGATHLVVVHDIHQCAADPSGSGITVQGLFANDVALTRVVPYPSSSGAGPIPALMFSVAADGRIVP